MPAKDEGLRKLVREKLAIVRAGLPAEVTLEAYLWDSDVREAVGQGDRGIAEAYAWLQGVADAFDVLVTQVVEDAGGAEELAATPATAV